MANAKPFSPEDSAALAGAVELLESPGIFIRTVNLVGAPVEYVLKKLPKAAQEKINQATNMALQGALVMAVKTLNPKHHGTSSDWMHKIIVMATGGAGGFFGLAGLPVELPLSTGIMLRSIADIARSEGENLEDVKVRLACLEVFALGGSSSQDDASETSYYMTRAALARTLSEAAEFIACAGIRPN